MSIGYACLTIGVPDTNQKSCMLRNANQEKLMELIQYNLIALEHTIDYNIENNIKLFRISSDVIPFASNPVNQMEWWRLFDNQLQAIGSKIKNSGMRVSMHPGQYTVLNSLDRGVVERATQDLNYHAQFLTSLGMNAEHKIILHIGGVYNDKESAVDRFISNYKQLNESVKARLVIENDDKSYNISEVLEIGLKLKIPVVFDNLHHAVNPCDRKNHDVFWINECRKTWKEKDGLQKMHYSQQNPNKQKGSHSNTIQINEFIKYYESIERKDIDIMLEVKDKNMSAVKCINCTSLDKKIKVLELEWSRYKYKILEKSPETYNQIRRLLRDKELYLAVPFYNLIEEALQMNDSVGYAVNAAQHVWGYFSNKATVKEKDYFLKKIEAFQQEKIPINTIKNILWKLTIKYNQAYLIDSYYFVL